MSQATKESEMEKHLTECTECTSSNILKDEKLLPHTVIITL